MTAEPAAAPSEAVEPSEALQPMAPEAFPAVELRSIGRAFGSDPPVYALRDVDLTVEHGTSLAIVGPSGSGKSTLLNILGCLDRPTSGTYLLDGIDVGEPRRRRARRAAGARRIGFVFQTFNLLAHRTVLENVMLAEVYRGAAREGRRRARDGGARARRHEAPRAASCRPGCRAASSSASRSPAR